MWYLTFQKYNNPQEADYTNSKTLATLFNKHVDWAEINKNSFSSVWFFFFFCYCRVIQSKDTKYSHCDNRDRIRTLDFLT